MAEYGWATVAVGSQLGYPVTQRTRRMQAPGGSRRADRLVPCPIRRSGRQPTGRADRFYVRAISTGRPPSVTGALSYPARGKVTLGRRRPRRNQWDQCGVFANGYPGRQAERFGTGLAVVLGGDLAEADGPACGGATADLAARDRKTGDGHREAAGAGLAGRPEAACCSRRLRRALTFRCGGGHWQHRPAVGGAGVGPAGPEGSSVPGAPPSPRPSSSQGRLPAVIQAGSEEGVSR